MPYQAREVFVRDVSHLDDVMKDWKRYRESVALRDLLDNRDSRNMVLYAMLVTIQAAIRTAHHLIVREYLPKPGTYEETFTILRKAGVLDGEVAEAMARLATYRQELVHSHHQMDLREIYEVLCEGYPTLESYRVKLEKLVRTEE